MVLSEKRSTYHHGDLRGTLVAVAIEMVRESGPHHFSLAEASRRAGVSAAAPYRHFAAKEDLLVEVALSGYQEVRTRFQRAIRATGAPADQLAGAVRAFVDFALEEPGLYDTMFNVGIDKREHPRLAAAADDLLRLLEGPATTLCSGRVATDLAFAVAVLANGYATLSRDSTAKITSQLPSTAERAVRALVAGRRRLADSSADETVVTRQG